MQDIPYRFHPTSANGFNSGGPNSSTLSSNNLYEEEACFSLSRLLKKWGTRVTMSLVLVVGFGFNVPRWLEWETISYYETGSPLPENQNSTFHGTINKTMQDRNKPYGSTLSEFQEPIIYDNSNNSSFGNQLDHAEDGVVVKTTARRSDMIDNESYFFFYHLLGSCIVMILIPAVILLWAYCSFRKMTPTGANKRRTHRIMLIIITMFFVCHCPKVTT